MTDTTCINVISYGDNFDGGGGEPEPLVHLLARDTSCRTSSITFHPDRAEEIAKAIIEAGKAAKEGRDTKCKFFFTK